MSRRDRLKTEALNEPLARQKVNEFDNPSFSSDYSSAFDIGKNMHDKDIVERVFFDFNTNTGYSLGGMAPVIKHSISPMVDSSDPVISSLAVDVCVLACTLFV